MRSFFWRILISFWLAISIAAGLSMFIGYLFNQDTWLVNKFPAIQGVAKKWVNYYETNDMASAKKLIMYYHSHFKIDIQVFTESGTNLTLNISHSRFRPPPPDKQGTPPPPPWRQVTQAYTSPLTGENYLFIYKIPRLELINWQRKSAWRPISGIVITLGVLLLFSLFLTLSITRPLKKLRGAVNDLGRTEYQKNSLSRLANRKDEFGLLAKDFSLMGEHLQSLIDSQRQLLRDVSHELRSPLARLKITAALLERANEQDRTKLADRLSLECDRLEILISEILTLARLDSVPSNKTTLSLYTLLNKLREDAKIVAPQQNITLSIPEDLVVQGWEDRLERAFDNLIRNALRFNPEEQAIEITAWQENSNVHITVRDHGVGVSENYLTELSKPFFRAPEQTAKGYGLGLAISRRAIESHGGKILFNNHQEGGFIVEIILPVS